MRLASILNLSTRNEPPQTFFPLVYCRKACHRAKRRVEV